MAPRAHAAIEATMSSLCACIVDVPVATSVVGRVTGATSSLKNGGCDEGADLGDSRQEWRYRYRACRPGPFKKMEA